MAVTAPRDAASDRSRRALLIFAPLVVFASLAALFFVRLYSGDVSILPSALIGKDIPVFDLPPVEGLGGKPGFSDADLHQGKVTLVNVFASWCVPCHQEHELLMRLASDPELARLGVRLFGLSYKDDVANVARFLTENGDPFAKVGTDRKGRTAIDWGVYGVPETFVVRGDGKIAYRFVGPVTEERFRDAILPAIKKVVK
ncbi:MAG TPA: DsbE family thiol:disulfide interchange protein [Methylocella sp.]|nr:DsbE family thiol:disulfide interchange protein [Methylocella sp.]